jgi:hypothetical protein
VLIDFLEAVSVLVKVMRVLGSREIAFRVLIEGVSVFVESLKCS